MSMKSSFDLNMKELAEACIIIGHKLTNAINSVIYYIFSTLLEEQS